MDAPAATLDRRNMLQNALGAIERLQARLAAAEDARHEPIAIVGMSCRVPGGIDTIDAYWDALAQGRDLVTEVPADRWDVEAYYDPDPSKLGKARTKAGGFLKDIEQFEPAFFGMSPREAAGVDPQQRLLLECAWEALEDAGIAADRLDGSLTGVFVGITSTDYAQRIDVADPARSDIYLATGTALNAAAGRVSFTFGLRGPCMAIDTACSSSLVAVHAACQSLRTGESDLALAGGVNAILSPDPFVLISKWGMLAPDGRCKTFDASANGFVRSEGCGLIVLERLSDALAKGHRVMAVISGSAINQDGRSSGLTVPNGLAQQEVVRQALASARLKPSDVSYVEAHGTGTSLGDPIEVEALAAVYGEGRAAQQPLEIGSVKSNIGHLEAASGVMSVIKLVLALQHRQLPASLHVQTPTPAIPWDRIPVVVSTRLHAWSPAGGRCIAGASAFGFSGMNAHVLIAQAPAVDPAPAPAPAEPVAQLLPLSAKTDAALAALARRYADRLEQDTHATLRDVCATAAVGRVHLGLRAALVARDRATVVAQLRELAEGGGAAMRGQAAAGARRRVAFLFTGQGSQYAGMGRELYDSEPLFRASIDRCAAVLNPLLGRSLVETLFADPSGELDRTAITQPALYAIEVSLAALWRGWGVEPAVVVGHSVGEFAAAAVAGVFSVEDGARLIAARGRLMQALPAGGAMVSVQGDAAQIEREVQAHAGTVAVAASNAPGSLVISGAAADVEAIAARLAQRGMRTQALVVSHAFHSPLMRPMVESFRALAATVPHAAPSIAWISNLTGAPLHWSEWGGRMADYWARHVLEPVAFAQGIAALDGFGCDAHVEVGPHPTLIGLGRQCLPDDDARRVWLPSIVRNRPARETLLDSLGRLYVRGFSLDWAAVHAEANHSLSLPTYPFQRQAFLVPFAPRSRRPAADPVHPLLGERLSVAGVVAQFERSVSSAEPAWVADHRIAGEVVMPLTAYLEAMLAAARLGDAAAAGLRDVEVGEPMVLREASPRVMQVVATRGEADDVLRLRVYSRERERQDAAWTLHASAVAEASAAADGRGDAEPLDRVAGRLADEVAMAPFYAKLHALGVEFGPSFQALRHVRCGAAEALGEVELAAGQLEDFGAYLLHPALLDACFHVSAVAMETLPGADDGRMYLPIGVERYHRLGEPAASMRVHARIRPPAVRGDMLVMDLRIETPDGRPVARLEGLRCRRANREMFRQRAHVQVADWLYDVAWKPAALPAGGAADCTGSWLVFDEGRGIGRRLAAQIAAQGGRVVRAVAEPSDQADTVWVAADDAQAYRRAIERVAADGPLRGVVSLWPLRVPTLGAQDVPSALQRFGTDAGLLLLQALVQMPQAAARLWFVTGASQCVDGTERLRIEQAPAAGLALVAATEHPELGVTLLDLDPQPDAADIKRLADELAAAGDEHRVAWRKGQRYVARLARRQRAAAVPSGPVRLRIEQRGTLENLRIADTERRPPGPGEVELEVRASGLNFRDVLSALGMYPGEIKNLGSDCAGVVTAVGAGVTAFAVGERVVAMAEGSFASHATTRWEFVAPLPHDLDFEQGAAIPTAYLTADITLNLIAGMKRGDRVLIHSGAGGVGMAAIALARRAGAEIFATAGSPEKRAILQEMGVAHVLDSRSTSFGDEIDRITGGRGVDIVLNSLAGPLLDRSFACLADGGTFLEIGKRGLWTHEQVQALGRGIRYHIVDCNDNARDTPEIVGQIFARVLREIESGVLPPLRCTVFPFEAAPDAFRYMAQARHTGRVVFRHQPARHPTAAPVRGDSSYLVTGGLKGLGLLAARSLVDDGARHLLLAGRSAADAAAAAEIEAMRAAGVQVTTVQADVSGPAGIERLMEALDAMPALGGVIHCAAVLDDGMLARQTPARFAAVLAPKADAAWRLHCAIAARGGRPDFFVLYSSLSAVFGAGGQGNYVAANTFLDALAQWRRGRDLPATSIGWGAWAEVGMATRGSVVARAGAQGLEALSPSQGTQALALLLREDATRVAVAPIDWMKLNEQLEGGPAPSLLVDLVDEARRHGARGAAASAGRREVIDFAALDVATRGARIADVVRHELATVLGSPGMAASIDAEQPFTQLGLDSLTSVELRNRLQQAIGRPLAPTVAFDWPTVGAMTAHLSGLFGAVAVATSDADAQNREEVTL